MESEKEVISLTKLNFDEVIERRGTGCEKWDALKEFFGREDLVALWVADMDFKAPPEVVEAFKKAVEHGIFGYTHRLEEYYEAIIGWVERHHNWKIKREWISHSPGVIPGINVAILALTVPGDKIIIQPPVYPPFRRSILENGRQLVYNPLRLEGNRFVMDFEDLERKIDDRTRMLILCSPHNPGGRVWTKEELKTLSEICLKHNLIVLSDEIHCDIVFKGYKHIPLQTVSEEIAQRSIAFISPSKTFNLAGLRTSVAIIPNENIRKAYNAVLKALNIGEANTFGMIALEAAYKHGDAWLNELLSYLEGNLKFLDEFFKERIPELELMPPEGTYVPLVNCEKLKMTPKELWELFIEKAHVAVNLGANYGPGGENFIRINIATPRKILKEGLERIEKAIHHSKL